MTTRLHHHCSETATKNRPLKSNPFLPEMATSNPYLRQTTRQQPSPTQNRPLETLISGQNTSKTPPK
uniref:Putative ovule protein n=1 Tax=Solanum chacoense TaxID=4108 RepID=A0A0V0GKA3_SOLCH